VVALDGDMDTMKAKSIRMSRRIYSTPQQSPIPPSRGG
jgi:hypothetical protein